MTKREEDEIDWRMKMVNSLTILPYPVSKLERLYNEEIYQVMQKAQEETEVLTGEDANRALVFFNLASAKIERLSKQLMHKELVEATPETDLDEGVEFLAEETSHRVRIEFLHKKYVIIVN